MSQAQPRPSSPRTGRSSVPWFTTRVVSLLLAWCWGIIGAASGKHYSFLFFSPSDFLRNWFNNGLIGINALVKSNDQKSAVNRAVPRPTIVTINVRGNGYVSWLAFLEFLFRTDVYVLGVLTSTACILIVAFTTTFLGMTLCRPKSFRSTLFFQAVLLISSSAWLFSVLVPLTIFHAKRSAKVNAYLDGIQLPSYVVNTVENALDITSVYKRIQYCWCFCVHTLTFLTHANQYFDSENRRSPSLVYVSFHSVCSRHVVRHFFSHGPSWAGARGDSCSNWSPNKQDIHCRPW